MLKNTHNILQMAFVILLMLSFNVLAQDKNASKLDCKPLPQDKRFKALGYELGTCKSDVENLIGQHGGTIESVSYGYHGDASGIFPENLTAIKSNYIKAGFPHKDHLLMEPEAIFEVL